MTEFAITKIRNLEAKYNDHVMFMAIIQLFEKGVENFKSADIEAACAEIRTTTSEKSIISADLQEQILRCAAELAHFDICDILHYVQTNIRLHNVSVHPDLTVKVIDYSSDETIAAFALPAETDPYAVMEICDRLAEVSTTQKKAVTKELLFSAFRKEGLYPINLAFDVINYV